MLLLLLVGDEYFSYNSTLDHKYRIMQLDKYICLSSWFLFFSSGGVCCFFLLYFADLASVFLRI